MFLTTFTSAANGIPNIALFVVVGFVVLALIAIIIEAVTEPNDEYKEYLENSKKLHPGFGQIVTNFRRDLTRK